MKLKIPIGFLEGGGRLKLKGLYYLFIFCYNSGRLKKKVVYSPYGSLRPCRAFGGDLKFILFGGFGGGRRSFGGGNFAWFVWIFMGFVAIIIYKGD